MPMQTPQDLFMHELADLYGAEQRIEKMLPLMAQECDNREVQNTFRQHETETRQHISNLEQCFRVLGSQPQESICQTLAGLMQEHDAVLKEKPSRDVMTMYNLGSTAKAEEYAVVSYKGLIEKATLMGHQQVVQLLQQNLKQEESMTKNVGSLSKQVDQQMIHP